MSADDMPILPGTDTAAEHWPKQDEDGDEGEKYLEEMNPTLLLQSIRISKCLLNKASDNGCTNKAGLKMKIVLSDSKDKSEASPNAREKLIDEGGEDEDTDVIEDDSDKSSELKIVDSVDLHQKTLPDQQVESEKDPPKNSRKKRKVKEIRGAKVSAFKKRREEKEAAKRRAEEICKSQDNKAMANRIAIEFRNFRRFRRPLPNEAAEPECASGYSSAPVKDDVASKTLESRVSVELNNAKLFVPQNSPEAFRFTVSSEQLQTQVQTQLQTQTERSKFLDSLVSQNNVDTAAEHRATYSSTVPLSLSRHCTGSSSAGIPQSDLQPSSNQSPRDSPQTSLSHDQVSTTTVGTKHVTFLDVPRPVACSTPVATDSLPPTIYVARPLCVVDVPTDVVEKCEPKTVTHHALHPVYPVNNGQQFESSASSASSEAMNTMMNSPARLYVKQTPESVEFSSSSGFHTDRDIVKSTFLSQSMQFEEKTQPHHQQPHHQQSHHQQPHHQQPHHQQPHHQQPHHQQPHHQQPHHQQLHHHHHHRRREQTCIYAKLSRLETMQNGEKSSEHHRASTFAFDADRDRTSQTFDPKFSTFSVDNLTKIHEQLKDKSPFAIGQTLEEVQQQQVQPLEKRAPAVASNQSEQAASVDHLKPSDDGVSIVGNNEFQLAKPTSATGQQCRPMTLPIPTSGQSYNPQIAIFPIGSSSTGGVNHPLPESKRPVSWRHGENKTANYAFQSIDRAVDTVAKETSQSLIKPPDDGMILSNYLQDLQQKRKASGEVTREQVDRTLETASRVRDPRSQCLLKLKRMLVTLQKFSNEISMDVGKTVYYNIYALASKTATIEKFITKTQRSAKMTLKPYVGPFLTSYLPLLQKEISAKAARVKISSSRYMRLNPECLIDPAVEPGRPHEIFVCDFDGLNKKKFPPTAADKGSCPTLQATAAAAQEQKSEHVTNAILSLRVDNSRYHTQFRIQSELMLIQEMLEQISRKVESTKKALYALQNSSSSLATGRNLPAARSLPCSFQPTPPSGLLLPFRESAPRLAANHSLSPFPSGAVNVPNFASFTAQSEELNSFSLNSARTTVHHIRPDDGNAGLRRKDPRTEALSSKSPSDHISSSPTLSNHLLQLPPVAPMNKLVPIVANARSNLLSATSGALPKHLTKPTSNPEEIVAVLQSSNSGSVVPTVSTASGSSSSSSSSTALESMYQENPAQNTLNAEPKRASSALALPQRLVSQQTGNLSNPEHCWNCGRSARETCGGCKMAKYCGIFCQHIDWEIHHKVCSGLMSDLPAQQFAYSG